MESLAESFAGTSRYNNIEEKKSEVKKDSKKAEEKKELKPADKNKKEHKKKAKA